MGGRVRLGAWIPIPAPLPDPRSRPPGPDPCPPTAVLLSRPFDEFNPGARRTGHVREVSGIELAEATARLLANRG